MRGGRGGEVWLQKKRKLLCSGQIPNVSDELNVAQ